jgi:hypothetical protein
MKQGCKDVLIGVSIVLFVVLLCGLVVVGIILTIGG